MKKLIILMMLIVVLAIPIYGVKVLDVTHCNGTSSTSYEDYLYYLENGSTFGWAQKINGNCGGGWSAATDAGRLKLNIQSSNCYARYQNFTNVTSGTITFQYDIMADDCTENSRFNLGENSESEGYQDSTTMYLVQGLEPWHYWNGAADTQFTTCSDNVWVNMSMVVNASDSNKFSLFVHNGTGWALEADGIAVRGTMTSITELRQYGTGTNFNTYIDNIRMFEGTVCPAALAGGGPGDPPVASFFSPTPSSATHNNTLSGVYVNVSCTNGGNATIYWDTNVDPITVRGYSLTNNTQWELNSTGVPSEGTYYYKGGCDNVGETNTSVRTWIYDTTKPAITLESNSGISALNATNNPYDVYLVLNFTTTDAVGLFGFEVNINFSNGTMYYNYTNQTLGNITSYPWSNNFSNTAWPDGTFTIDVWASDVHTKNKIGDYKPKRISSGIEFNTVEGNYIKIESEGDSVFSSEKDIDRYGIKINFDDDKDNKKRRLFITSDHKITYMADSNYLGHFIVGNPRGGNWIDFEGVNTTVKVTKLTDYIYQLDFDKLKDIEKFKSIGGLNVQYRSFKYSKGVLTLNNVYLSPATPVEDSTINAYCQANEGVGGNINYTWIWYVNDTHYVNGTLLNVANSTPALLYTSLPTHPVGVNYTLSCQASADVYSTAWLNSSQATVTGYSVDNCSVYNGTTGFNVSFFDSSDVLTSLSYEVFMQYGTTSTYEFNYTIDSAGGVGFGICFTPPGASIITDMIIEFNNQSYNTYQLNLTNTTQHLALYTQDGASLVTFSVNDYSNDPVENAYIHILKWDTGSNSYATTEVLRTDVNGEAVGNIVLNTVYYRFVVQYQGDTKLIDPATQGIKIYSTTRNFKISLEETEWFDDYNTFFGAITNLIFNNDTNSFVYTWTDPSSAMHKGCMRVTQSNATSHTVLSDACTESTSSSIVYGITPANGSTFTAIGYFQFDNEYVTDILKKVFEAGYELYEIGEGNFSMLMAFMLVMALVFIGLPAPGLALALGGVGMIGSAILGLWNVNISLVVAILIIGIIYLVKMNRQ